MGVVGGHDCDELHAFDCRQRSLGCHHLTVIGVDPLRRQIQYGARATGAVRVAAESATDQLDFTVKGSRHAVHLADKGTLAATDHAHSEFCHHYFPYRAQKLIVRRCAGYVYHFRRQGIQRSESLLLANPPASTVPQIPLAKLLIIDNQMQSFT
jgi:hypothetical protein